MGRPEVQPGRETTRERLLQAAVVAFGSRGFEGARLEDIAREAGIGRSSLLYWYSSKEALYTEVVTRTFDELANLLAAVIDAEGTFHQRVEVLVRTFVGYFESRPDAARIVVREIVSGGELAQAILRDGVGPVLSLVEAFLEKEGHGQLRNQIPPRVAVLHVVSDALVRASAGAMRDPIWGPVDVEQSVLVARALLTEERP